MRQWILDFTNESGLIVIKTIAHNGKKKSVRKQWRKCTKYHVVVWVSTENPVADIT